MGSKITPELEEKITDALFSLAVPVSVQKAAFRIFAVPTVCITRNINIIRKLF